MRYSPFHFDFRGAYLYDDLPTAVTDRLAPLFFVRDEADLASKATTARGWFEEACAAVDPADLARRMGG
jgi:hypothetical protein